MFKVARTWEIVNLGIKQWAERHPNVVYVTVKLEDICSSNRQFAIESLLDSLKIKMNNSDIRKISNLIVDNKRCKIKKYLNYNPSVIRDLSLFISKGLTNFLYPIKKLTTIIQETAFNTPWDAQKNIILTFVNDDYNEIFINWLRYMKDIDQTNGILIITTSKSIFKILNCQYINDCYFLRNDQKEIYEISRKFKLGSIYLPYYLRTKTTTFIWKERMKIMSVCLSLGINTLLSDLDAIWLKNPFKMGLFSNESYFDNQIQPFNTDIIASKGKFPQSVKQIWGGSVCMGYIFIRSGESTIKLLKLTLKSINYVKDDQKAFNEMILKTFSPEFESIKGKNYTLMQGQGIFGNLKLSVILLPFELIPRYCTEDLKLSNMSKSTNLKTFYPNAIIIHCLSKKKGHYKKELFIKTGLWKGA